MTDRTSFAQYVNDQNQKHQESSRPHDRHNILYFDTAYSEIRHKNMREREHKKHIEFHKKHHEEKERRKAELKDAIEVHNEENALTSLLGTLLENADDGLHDHPEVKSPHEISKEESAHIKLFTGKSYDDVTHGHASSRNMNTYLRSQHSPKYKWEGVHDEGKTKKAIDTLHSIIKKHSNRKEVTVYTGVPHTASEEFEKHGKESKHMFPGFTSTTSSRRVAQQFAAKSQEHPDHPLHIIKATVHPGNGMTVRNHSHFRGEHEFSLNKGAKLTYHRTTKHTDEDGQETHLHHVTVHSTD